MNQKVMYSFQEGIECYLEQSIKLIHNPLKISNNKTFIWNLEPLGKLCSICENISSALSVNWGFPSGSDGKESARHARDLSLILRWKVPWRRECQPTPVFLSGELHGRRSLAGYSPWDHKESDTTYQLNNNNNNNVGVNVSCQICSWCAQIGLEYYPT